MTTYQPRLMDQRPEELLRSVPAVSVEGARAVGKTCTARAHGTTFHKPLTTLMNAPIRRHRIALHHSSQSSRHRRVVATHARVVGLGTSRRRRRSPPGRFLLTGSLHTVPGPTQYRRRRIITLRMRPFSLAECAIETPTVPGGAPAPGAVVSALRPSPPWTPIGALMSVTIDQYVDEICRSASRHQEQL